MDEKAFKKHLTDLAHGHHHPDEHDCGPDPAPRRAPSKPARKTGKTAKKTRVKR